MIIKVLFVFFANVLFLYFFWLRLKEDYFVDNVFTTAVYVIIAATISQVISNRFFPQWWFWAGFFAVLIGLTLGIYRYKFRIIELVEALLLSLIPVLIMIFLYQFISKQNIIDLFVSLYLLFLIFTFYFLNKHYKRFAWYKSGRIGFSGLTIAGLFFLSRAAVASFFPDVLSFSGKYEVYLSGVCAFLAFLGVFNLARQKT
jgi:hypothetical protein